MLETPKRVPSPTRARTEEAATVDKDSDADSFVKELKVLRASYRAEKDTKLKPKPPGKPEEAQVAASPPSPPAITEETTAKIREASAAIDKVLLVALRPFETKIKEQELAEATKAAEAAKLDQENPIKRAAGADLPTASQKIVEQLELAFGDMTERKNTELKAETDAVAAAKQAEKAKKKAESDAAAAAEREAKEKQAEVLRLLPLQGKLLSTSLDIDEALIQMEASDRQRGARIATRGTLDAMEALRRETERRMQQIEARVMRSHVAEKESWQWQPRSSEWLRENYEQVAPASIEVNESGSDGEHEPSDFHAVVQQEVIEKLELTILKLRHVLSIDAKEAAEAAEVKKVQDSAKRMAALKKEGDDAKKQQELDDAEAARRRVMGLTSLEQVHDWMEADTQMQEELRRERVGGRLALGLQTRAASDAVGQPSALEALWMAEFDHAHEMRSFEQLERAMQAREPGHDEREQAAVSHDSGDDEDDDEMNNATNLSIHRPLYAPSNQSEDGRSSHDSPDALDLGNPYDPPPPRRRSRDQTNPRAGHRSRAWEPSLSPAPPAATRKPARSKPEPLGRRLAATIEAFQCERRAKAKWIKAGR